MAIIGIFCNASYWGEFCCTTAERCFFFFWRILLRIKRKHESFNVFPDFLLASFSHDRIRHEATPESFELARIYAAFFLRTFEMSVAALLPMIDGWIYAGVTKC